MAKSKTDPTTKKADAEQPTRRRAPARPRATTKRSRPAAAAAQQPTSEQIAGLAYELYIQRGRVDGSHVEDWLEAERILKSRG